jgi:hypothetical protein
MIAAAPWGCVPTGLTQDGGRDVIYPNGPSDASAPTGDGARRSWDVFVDRADAALAADGATVADSAAIHDVTRTCRVDAPTACDGAAPRYPEVARILQQRCVTCHDGTREESWPLTSYEHVADWQNAIRAELVTCRMPPADAGAPLSEEEADTILMWIRCGLPR